MRETICSFVLIFKLGFFSFAFISLLLLLFGFFCNYLIPASVRITYCHTHSRKSAAVSSIRLRSERCIYVGALNLCYNSHCHFANVVWCCCISFDIILCEVLFRLAANDMILKQYNKVTCNCGSFISCRQHNIYVCLWTALLSITWVCPRKHFFTNMTVKWAIVFNF